MRRILQTPAMIAILYDDLTYRQIFLDGWALETDPSAFAQPCGSEVQSGPRCRIQGSHIVANQRTGLFRAVIATNKPVSRWRRVPSPPAKISRPSGSLAQ